MLFECARCGISVPEAFSLVGFGDLEFSSFCNPSLTTIRPSANLIARSVTNLVLSRIKGEPEVEQGHVVEIGASMIVRSSS